MYFKWEEVLSILSLFFTVMLGDWMILMDFIHKIL